ncbi:HD domain-containing protein [soil metagenome]
MASGKIINDPVYGFITIDDDLIFRIIAHPYYQRLRRIHQMAMAQLVYPGAVHTRLHHSLGAYHLMSCAMIELNRKGFEITAEEQQAGKIAILLHDLGHGPYSHALEHTLIPQASHEELSLLMMQRMNTQMDGRLQMAIDIFTDSYPKEFLHQLVSGQLDVDRMDYITRDSFFSGVNEGTIGYDRILKMLTVYQGQLMIEEKGIYSTEKFLVSRRLMYWQVYFHKTVLTAEKMLQHIITRARNIRAFAPTDALNFFLSRTDSEMVSEEFLQNFCSLDDTDIMMAIKKWSTHPDKILSILSEGLLNRKLLKVKYFSEPVLPEVIEEKKKEVMQKLAINAEEAELLVFDGFVENRTYNSKDEHIKILYKDGTVKDISEVDNALINQSLYKAVKKFYLCYHK